MTSLRSRIGQVTRQVRRITQTHYPAFLFGSDLAPDERYAFVYHDVEPSVFRRDLEFLADNQYATVGIDEFVHETPGPSQRRSVLITFDDARLNFWEVAFPILAEYEARATLFVPTLWVAGSDRASRQSFMNWDQIRECAASGHVDVESHAHRHALVYTGDRVVAWATPVSLTTYDEYEWPLRLRDDNELLGPPPLGTPIYASTPLLSAKYGMVDSHNVTKACQDLVESEGGESFFETPGWLSRLTNRYREASVRERPAARMDDGRFRALVASDLTLSREQFVRELGRPPRFLAYPWMLGSELSLLAAETNGIEAVFGVGLDFRRARDVGGPMAAFGRLKGDWLRLLPGVGRQRLTSVVASKLRGLTSPEHLSH